MRTKLRMWRDEFTPRLSQKAVADQLKPPVAAQTYQRWEYGESAPPEHYWEQLGKVFNRTYDEVRLAVREITLKRAEKRTGGFLTVQSAGQGGINVNSSSVRDIGVREHEELSPDIKYFISLYTEYGNQKLLQEFTRKLLQMKMITDGAKVKSTKKTE